MADLGIIFLRRRYPIHWYQSSYIFITGSMPFRYFWATLYSQPNNNLHLHLTFMAVWTCIDQTIYSHDVVCCGLIVWGVVSCHVMSCFVNFCHVVWCDVYVNTLFKFSNEDLVCNRHKTILVFFFFHFTRIVSVELVYLVRNYHLASLLVI